MAATLTTVTDISAPVDVVFQQTFLSAAKQRCPYFEGSVPADLVQHGGSFTAKWRRFEHFTPTTTALTALTGTLTLPTRDSVSPTITDVTKAVAKYGQVVYLNEEVDLVNPNGSVMQIADRLGASAGRSLNMLQRNEMEDNATALRPSTYASDGAIVSKITAAVLKKCINTLERNSAETFTAQDNGSPNYNSAGVLPAYWGITHPDVAADIAALTGFVSVERYSPRVQTSPFEFGYLGLAGRGIRFISSEDASIDTSTGASGAASAGLRTTSGDRTDLYSTVVFGQDAVGSLGFGMQHVKASYKAGDKLPGIMIINKPRGSAGAADPLDEVSTLAWKSWHGAKILNSNWIRCIRSGAGNLNS